MTLKDWNLSFYSCLNAYKLDGIFIQEKIVCHIFLFLCHILSFGSSSLNCEFIRREYGFSINSKISLMSSGNKPILILKISFKSFVDFDILQVQILKLYFQSKIDLSEKSSVELFFKPVLKLKNAWSSLLPFDFFSFLKT